MNAEGQVAWTECVRRAMNMARIESKANSTVGLFAVGIPAADAELRALRKRVTTLGKAIIAADAELRLLRVVAKAARLFRDDVNDAIIRAAEPELGRRHMPGVLVEAHDLDAALVAAGFGPREQEETGDA